MVGEKGRKNTDRAFSVSSETCQKCYVVSLVVRAACTNVFLTLWPFFFFFKFLVMLLFC